MYNMCKVHIFCEGHTILKKILPKWATFLSAWRYPRSKSIETSFKLCYFYVNFFSNFLSPRWILHNRYYINSEQQVAVPEINVTNGHTESGSNKNAIVAPSKFLELPPSLLTVADEAFQRKSNRKLGSFKRKNHEKKSGEKRSRGSFKRLLKKDK